MSSEKLNGFNDENFIEIQMPVPWGIISGKWWGSNEKKQPIIAIHGWQDNAGTFDTLAPKLLDKGHSLFCIDLPGHGFSSHLPSGQHYYLFWDGVHIIRRLVKHFNWTNIIILGHSLGGGIAFMYAAIYPNEIKKYISLDIASPSVRNNDKIIKSLGPSIDKFFNYETLMKDQIPCYEYDEMIDIVYDGYQGSVTKESCKIMMKRGMKPAPNKLNSYIFTRDIRLKVAALGFLTEDQVLEFANNIQCQVLNIRGNPGMKFDNPSYYDIVLDTIKKKAKHLEKHLIDGTHHLHLNEPEKIVDIIDNFLKID